jgi:hypothetical protein
MPIWGAALSLIEHPIHYLNVSYYHKSHRTLVSSLTRSGYFRPDIPMMLIYYDQNHTAVVNTRISVVK